MLILSFLVFHMLIHISQYNSRQQSKYKSILKTIGVENYITSFNKLIFATWAFNLKYQWVYVYIEDKICKNITTWFHWFEYYLYCLYKSIVVERSQTVLVKSFFCKIENDTLKQINLFQLQVRFYLLWSQVISWQLFYPNQIKTKIPWMITLPANKICLIYW